MVNIKLGVDKIVAVDIRYIGTSKQLARVRFPRDLVYAWLAVVVSGVDY